MERNLKKQLTYFALVLSLFFSQFSGAADAEIQIKLPEHSVSGSFVIKLLSKQVSLANSELELWRKREHGDYELISKQPCISALSQTLFEGGLYTYQAKLYLLEGANRILSAVSEPQEIKIRENKYRFSPTNPSLASND